MPELPDSLGVRLSVTERRETVREFVREGAVLRREVRRGVGCGPVDRVTAAVRALWQAHPCVWAVRVDRESMWPISVVLPADGSLWTSTTSSAT